MANSDLIKAMLLDSLERGDLTIENVQESAERGQRLQEMGFGEPDDQGQAAEEALKTWQQWTGGAA
jgi:hypothetical protein